MAKQVFENKDLVRLIYGFEPEHRVKMKEVCKYILYPQVSPYKGLLSPVVNAFKDTYRYYIYLEFFLKKRCHCCSRHCHRKPDIRLEDGMLVYKDGDNERVPECKDMHDCDCNCRHVCRKIISIFPLVDM